MKLKLFLLSLVAVCFVSNVDARSRRKEKDNAPKGDVEIVVPCSGLEFLTSADYFRANAMGISNSMEIASQKAMTAARAKISAAIETTVKTVTDSYISSYEENQTEEARSRFQSMTREVVSQKLAGIRVICNKTMQTPEGAYKCYVAIELAGDEIASGINDGAGNDSKLRTDFEYEQFKGIFEEEMSKLADEQ